MLRLLLWCMLSFMHVFCVIFHFFEALRKVHVIFENMCSCLSLLILDYVDSSFLAFLGPFFRDQGQVVSNTVTDVIVISIVRCFC